MRIGTFILIFVALVAILTTACSSSDSVEVVKQGEAGELAKNGKIAFASERDGRTNIYMMNPDGSDVMQLTDAGGAGPSWSPDGWKITFISGRGMAPFIYVMDAYGSNQTALTGMGRDFYPDWGPAE